MRSIETLSLAVAVALSACVVDDPEIGEDTAASTVDNGQNLNGQNLNGQNLNGQNLNGQNLNGQNLNGSTLGSAIAWVEYAGAQRGEVALDRLLIQGSELVGWSGGVELRGSSLVGVTLAATSDTGKALALRIDDATLPNGSDAWRYRVKYRETDGSWWPICYDAHGNATNAYALRGYWNRDLGTPGGGGKVDDPAVFTFACRGAGAIGKCVDIGYRPWASVSGTSLDAHHQACVRLLRNDYCGDGTAHTVDGTIVNLYDALGIQLDTETWNAEAEWDAYGARCVTEYSRASKLDKTCISQKLKKTCGDPAHFAEGVLLMSEMP